MRGGGTGHERVVAAGEAGKASVGTASGSIALWYHLARTMKARADQRFEDEIAILEHELTHELPKEIKRARELGDLRENAEYHAAKERQRLVETRITMLRTRVAEIALHQPRRIPADRAGFGSTVTVIENRRPSCTNS